MKYILYFLFFSNILLSQNTQYIDSVKSLTTSKVDTVRFWAYSELSWLLKETDKTAALNYSSKLYDEAKEINNSKWMAQGLNDAGIIYIKIGDLNKALEKTEQALALRKKSGNKKEIASSLSKIATIKTEKGQYAEALDIQLQVLRLFEELKMDQYVAQTCNNIGTLYNNINNPEMSNKYLKRAYAIAKAMGDNYTMPVTLSVMAGNFNDLEKIDSAIYCYSEAKKIFFETQEFSSYATACNNLAHLYRRVGNTIKGEENYREAIKVSKEIGDSAGLALYQNNLANVLIDREQFNEAELLLLESLKMSQKLGYTENILKIYQSLTGLYIQTKDSKKADFYFDRYRATKDSIFSNQIAQQFTEAQTKFDVEKKDLEISKNKAEIENEKNKRYITYGALAFFVLLFSLAIWAFIQKRKNNRLLEVKNSLLENANEEISHQKNIIEEKQKEIVDSINYAQKIQKALLASEEMLLENSLKHFILLKPKDIVSGDFTWATKKDHLLYLACCDSTGHGVPGAFMSLLNIGFLSEAIKERNITEPGKIFDYVRDRLIETIGKDEQRDGFDGVLICIDGNSNKISYAAAHNAPILISNNQLNTLSYDKMPVGKGVKDDSFNTYSLSYQKNDQLYLFTDGYADQFGGPRGKKFKYKQLEELLLNNHKQALEIQKDKLVNEFSTWKGDMEQVDDICIIGISL